MHIRGRSGVLALAFAPTPHLMTGCGGLLGGESDSRSIANTGGSASATSTTATGGSTVASVYCATGGQTGGDDCPHSDECECGLIAPGCSRSDAKADVRTVNMLLVVEASSLMNKRARPEDTETRWQLITSTLAGVLKTTAYDINWGIELFPLRATGSSWDTDVTEACSMPAGGTAIGTEVLPGLGSVMTILDTLNAHTPAGYSPLAQALDNAYAYYVEGMGQCLKGTRWVLLVSTGAADCNPSLTCGSGDVCVPNLEQTCWADAGVNGSCGPDSDRCANEPNRCSDEARVIDRIEKLSSAGIKTFVVGMPTTRAEVAILNRYADAGEVPNQSPTAERFYWLGSAQTGAQDLQNTFASVTTQLVHTCDIELADTPHAPASMRVGVDCRLVPADPSGVSDGYHLDQTYDPPHVILTGSYCDAIQQLGAMRVDVIYDCVH